MAKYCIYWDRPVDSINIYGEEVFGGCTIFGVYHHCEECPNLKEMPEGGITYTKQKTKEE